MRLRSQILDRDIQTVASAWLLNKCQGEIFPCDPPTEKRAMDICVQTGQKDSQFLESSRHARSCPAWDWSRNTASTRPTRNPVDAGAECQRSGSKPVSAQIQEDFYLRTCRISSCRRSREGLATSEFRISSAVQGQSLKWQIW